MYSVRIYGIGKVQTLFLSFFKSRNSWMSSVGNSEEVNLVSLGLLAITCVTVVVTACVKHVRRSKCLGGEIQTYTPHPTEVRSFQSLTEPINGVASVAKAASNISD